MRAETKAKLDREMRIQRLRRVTIVVAMILGLAVFGAITVPVFSTSVVGTVAQNDPGAADTGFRPEVRVRLEDGRHISVSIPEREPVVLNAKVRVTENASLFGATIYSFQHYTDGQD